MKRLKKLWNNHFNSILAIFAAVGLIIGAVYAHCSIDSIEKQHNAAVIVGALTVCAGEVPAPQPETAIQQPERLYFDVPLDRVVQDHIFSECEKYNIEPSVIIATIQKESTFNTYCLGDDGRSAGLMQIQAKWHLPRMIELDCTDLFDPFQNITVGINYLAELYTKYGCDYGKALTAYNQGSYKGTVTQYAKAVLNNAERMVRQYD